MAIRLAPRISEWRAVLRRWSFLGAVVGTPLLFAWWFMMRMPGTSHSGPLPPADDALRALAAELEADVRKLAVEIGERNTRRKSKLDEAGSQKYPAPGLAAAYPSQGDFVSFVSDSGARDLVREVVGEFRRAVKFPSEGAALPSGIPGVDWSDHWSFRQQGWPAVMVTDTAPFRSEHYHRPTDSVEHVDYERLARVVQGLVAVVGRLANPDR